MGCPTSPFIGEGKARVTEKEKEKNEREKKASRVVGPSSPSYGSRRSCRCQQGRLHVVALFVTSAMHRRHLPVMAFHSIPANGMVN